MKNTDLTQLTLDELKTAEKDLKKNGMYAALGVGFLAGVMVYGLVKNGFGLLYTAIPIFLILGIHKGMEAQRERLKAVQAEIGRK